ncbi:MAG: hypothetical protein H6642_07980 [Caldilineaceae bacterium]|nr:hypothetical protein [Caldilineaceae bacterium]
MNRSAGHRPPKQRPARTRRRRLLLVLTAGAALAFSRTGLSSGGILAQSSPLSPLQPVTGFGDRAGNAYPLAALLMRSQLMLPLVAALLLFMAVALGIALWRQA